MKRLNATRLITSSRLYGKRNSKTGNLNEVRASDSLMNIRAANKTDEDAIWEIFRAVIAPGDEPDWMKLLDLHMLVALGGREGSEGEWRELLAANGFRLEPLGAPGLLEAAPA